MSEIVFMKPIDGFVMQDAETSDMNQADRVVMIGTASKGIIDRQHQHNAQVCF